VVSCYASLYWNIAPVYAEVTYKFFPSGEIKRMDIKLFVSVNVSSVDVDVPVEKSHAVLSK
jgi:hypothetical protein